MDRRSILLGGVGLALGAGSSASGQQASQKRFALILANQTYEKNPLPNIDNDAALMGRTLKSLGFTVTTLMNGTRSTMRTKLKELKDNLAANPGGIGFVYYSGHGVQVDGENYLVPVNNGALTSEADVKEDCLSLSYVLEMSKGTQAKAYITVLDACRDNPFLGQKGDGNKGLAVVGRVLDASTLVAFAASPGETASATLGGANSIYTAELVKQLQTPNLALQEVFQATRSAVRTKSSNKQRPREDNGLEEQIYLNGRGSAVAARIEKESGSQSTSIRLELTGVPAGAKVTLDGTQLTGNVFTDDIVQKSKSFEVAVIAAGFKPYLYTVVVPRGGNLVHAVTLESKPKPANRLNDYPALRAYVESLRSIPAGTFQMGSSSGESDLKPVHSVTLSAFRMGATPVTVAVWREYCAALGIALPEAPPWGLLDSHPIVNVSWNDIMGADSKGGFCAWASDIAGFRLTLPTEAQWEYAARGGVGGNEFPWGHSFDDSKLWCSNVRERKQTAPVNRTSHIYRNDFGLTDMAGNVWQWCSDLYAPYSSGSQTDPVGPSSTSDNRRCVRGGSWYFSDPGDFGCAVRIIFRPGLRSSNLSTRLSAGPG
jgi:formylglycine-generating enzyme required for sulfatase activity